MALIRGSAQQQEREHQQQIMSPQADQNQPTVMQKAIRNAKHATYFIFGFFILCIILDLLCGRGFQNFGSGLAGCIAFWIFSLLVCFIVIPWFSFTYNKSLSFWTNFWNQRF